MLTANEMFFLAFGYEPEEIDGKFIDYFMPKHIAQNHDTYISKFAENKK